PFGLVVTGKAENPVYLEINNSEVSIKNAKDLWGLTDSQTREQIASITRNKATILTIGPGSESGCNFGIIASELAGSASSGFGSVMGSKKLKAIVATGTGQIKMAFPDDVTKIRKRIMTMTGKGYYNAYENPIILPGTTVGKKVHCHGCPQGCWRSIHISSSGNEGVRKCSSPMWYATWDKKLNGDFTEVSFEATNIIQDNTLCGGGVFFLMRFLERCYQRGILTENQAELPLSKMGSPEFLMAFIQKVISGEGFGSTLQKGYKGAGVEMGGEAEEIAGELDTWPYGPKLFNASALLYAVEPEPKISEVHELTSLFSKWSIWRSSKGKQSYLSTDLLRKTGILFWGSEESVDSSTYDGKALAAVKIQNREFLKESLILCDFAYPIFDDAGTDEHVGDPTLERQLFQSVTGSKINDKEFEQTGERIFSLNRIIHLLEGRMGRTDDKLDERLFKKSKDPITDITGAGFLGMVNPELELPGSGNEIVSKLGNAVDKNAFEKALSEYYNLRGWNEKSGLFTDDVISKLQLTEMTGLKSIRKIT
ncbi:aldehyde ferredoxin oxidoreductase C-terminal domain-containing protein, partial [Spirochaetota bacterium]